jgi:protein subunit release factor A
MTVDSFLRKSMRSVVMRLDASSGTSFRDAHSLLTDDRKEKLRALKYMQMQVTRHRTDTHLDVSFLIVHA